MGSVKAIEALEECGGVAEWSALRRLRVSRYGLTSEVAVGAVVRVRRGCFALPHADATLVAEIAWRGTTTCVTAAAALGLPARGDGRIHLSVPAGRSQSGRNLAAPGSVHRHPCGPDWRAEVPSYIADASRCLAPAELLCLVDAALNRGLISIRDVEDLRIGERQKTWLLRHADGAAQSPLETHARLALKRARIAFTPQVTIPGVGRVDFLVSDWLIVEVDGREHHALSSGFAADRRRDRAAVANGYRVVRFAYEDVMDAAGFVDSVRAALTSPLRPSRPLLAA